MRLPGGSVGFASSCRYGPRLNELPNHHSSAGCHFRCPVTLGSVSKPPDTMSHVCGRDDTAAFFASSVTSSVSVLAATEAPVVYDGPQTIGTQSCCLSTTSRRYANAAASAGPE